MPTYEELLEENAELRRRLAPRTVGEWSAAQNTLVIEAWSMAQQCMPQLVRSREALHCKRPPRGDHDAGRRVLNESTQQTSERPKEQRDLPFNEHLKDIDSPLAVIREFL